jgi:hypothetical protein
VAEISFRQCKVFFAAIYDRQRVFYYTADELNRDHQITLMPPFWYELKILDECRANLAQAALLVTARRSEELAGRLRAAAKIESPHQGCQCEATNGGGRHEFETGYIAGAVQLASWKFGTVTA